MPANVLGLIGLIIADAQSLWDELTHDDLARQHVEHLLNAAQFIRDEMNLYLNSDGSVNETIIVSGSYTRTPFALVENNVYLIKKLKELGKLSLSEMQLERLDAVAINFQTLRQQLDVIWTGK